MFAQENNKEQWERLAFVLQERDKPTLIVIGFDSYATQKNVFSELKKIFSQYKFYELDLSSIAIVSLNQIYINRLPKTVLNSQKSEYIVNVFGLENSLFTIKNDKIESSSLIAELNFEREILFQRFPFITIIWSDSYTVSKLKKEAKDLWDWISYYFEFKNDKETNIAAYRQDNNLTKTKIFISSAREDYKVAKRLYDDLRKHGFQPWLDSEDLLPGQNWRLAITKAIRESSYFLALLSSNAVSKTGFLHKEMKIALDTFDEFPPNKIFLIPIYLDPTEPYEGLREIHGINLYESYEEGLNKILRSLDFVKKKEKMTLADGEHFELNKQQLSEGLNRIDRLKVRYDSIKLDDTYRERVIKEKINIQKLLGQEYMELEDYEKAEQSFRIALGLSQQIDGLEYEKDEISFLLRQVHYQPVVQINETR